LQRDGISDGECRNSNEIMFVAHARQSIQ